MSVILLRVVSPLRTSTVPVSPGGVRSFQSLQQMDFEAMKELTTVILGSHENLIRPEVIGKLSGDSSFWTRWRAGFLSWDGDVDKALVNPGHRIEHHSPFVDLGHI